jgi:hypothetical protein
MRLSSGQGLYPAVILCSGVLTLVLFASLFQREAVVDISSRVAQKASDGFYGVKNKLSHETTNTGYLSTQANVNNPAYLEPEWEFAWDLSVVYTVSWRFDVYVRVLCLANGSPSLFFSLSCTPSHSGSMAPNPVNAHCENNLVHR